MPSNPQITTKVDVWAYGLIVNELMLVGKPYSFINDKSDAKIELHLMNKRDYKIKKISKIYT